MNQAEQPKRIQRKRTKGWRMPPNTVYVGRPTKWGNPFKVGGQWTPENVVKEYRRWLLSNTEGRKIAEAAKVELKGRTLSCWCHEGDYCHADVLLEIANL